MTALLYLISSRKKESKVATRYITAVMRTIVTIPGG